MSEEDNRAVKALDATEALADKIVVLVRDGDFRDSDWQEAVLLAQHRLFGSEYMNRLFSGRLNPIFLTNSMYWS